MRKIVMSFSLAGMFLVLQSPAAAGWAEGVAAFEASNYESAVREFRAVVEQHPAQVNGKYMLGLSYLRLERFTEAVPHLEIAALKSPDDAARQFFYGWALLRSSQTRYAVTALARAAELDREDPAKKRAYAMAVQRWVDEVSTEAAELQMRRELLPRNIQQVFDEHLKEGEALRREQERLRRGGSNRRINQYNRRQADWKRAAAHLLEQDRQIRQNKQRAAELANEAEALQGELQRLAALSGGCETPACS